MEHTQNDAKMRILKAAKELFAEKGYDGTTVREICEKAGSNIALVSYHFGGKENVFFTLFELFSPQKRLRVEEEIGDPVDGIKFIIDTMIQYIYDEPLMVSIIQQEIFLNSPRLSRICEYSFPAWVKLRKLLEIGRQAGTFEFRSLDRALIMIIATIIFPMKNPNFSPILKEGEMAAESIKQDTLEFVLNCLRYKNV